MPAPQDSRAESPLKDKKMFRNFACKLLNLPAQKSVARPKEFEDFAQNDSAQAGRGGGHGGRRHRAAGAVRARLRTMSVT